MINRAVQKKYNQFIYHLLV